MILKITMLMMLAASPEFTIYDFERQSSLENWIMLNDVVMGGQSASSLKLDSDGHAVYRGSVSLENNGGFSSLRYRFDRQEIESFSSVALRLKGDGLRYQFRVKTNKYDRHSYVQYFETSGKWEWVEIELGDMYPSWRGQKLRMANYPGEFMEEIAILIGNKKPEDFQLLIDKIILK